MLIFALTRCRQCADSHDQFDQTIAKFSVGNYVAPLSRSFILRRQYFTLLLKAPPRRSGPAVASPSIARTM